MEAKIDIDDDFEKAITVVLAHEGGYSFDGDDPGGQTKFGISKKAYPDVDIAALTLAQAKALYKRDYWDVHYKAFNNIELATKVFDLAVNMGPSWSHRLLQRALKAADQAVVEDGVLGSVTLACIHKAESSDLLAALKSEAAGYYRTLAATNPKSAKFLKGWLRRAYS